MPSKLQIRRVLATQLSWSPEDDAEEEARSTQARSSFVEFHLHEFTCSSRHAAPASSILWVDGNSKLLRLLLNVTQGFRSVRIQERPCSTFFAILWFFLCKWRRSLQAVAIPSCPAQLLMSVECAIAFKKIHQITLTVKPHTEKVKRKEGGTRIFISNFLGSTSCEGQGYLHPWIWMNPVGGRWNDIYSSKLGTFIQ
jgi:hypothetical protein